MKPRPLPQLLPWLAAALLAAPAFAATPLEVARQAASDARAQVRGLRKQQGGLRVELNQVARRIERLKAEGARGPELDTALRRSQELSGSLTDLAQQMTSAEGRAEQENLLWLEALSAELQRLRQRVEQTSDRGERAKLFGQLKALRQEREQVRVMLPAAKVPALEPFAPADDPEELLEQADAVRDREDKVRRELAALEGRIRELREERELERRLGDFLEEDSLFDESDRRLRLRGEALRAGQPRATPATESDSAPPVVAGSASGAPAPSQGTSNPTAPSSGAGSGGDVPTTGFGGGADRSPQTQSVSASDARPVVGQVRQGPASSGGHLKALEAEQQRLRSLADELRNRAEKLENQAKELGP